MRFLLIFIFLTFLYSSENTQETTRSTAKRSNRTFYVRFASAVNTPSKKLAREKRSVIELYNMVSCATGCNPLAYKGYGCYCGFLGSGEPVDEIDRCCAQHDNCYERSNCLFPFHYLAVYDWKCFSGVPYCANWNQGRSCSYDLCECDRTLAECLKKTSCPRSKVKCYSSRFW